METGAQDRGRGTALSHSRALVEMHALRSSWVVYERRTEARQGFRSVVYERGSQLVWQERFGMEAPIDDEEPFVGAYSYQREDVDGVDENGVRYSIQRLIRRPRPINGGARLGRELAGASSPVDGTELSPDHGGNAAPCECVAAPGEGAGGTTTWRVMLRDPAGVAAVPSLGTCVAAEALGAGEGLRRLRAERIGRRAEARRAVAEEVARVVARLGGEVARVRTGHGFSLDVALPAGAATQLAAHPRVAGVLRPTRNLARPDSLASSYLCTGLPVGLRADVDSTPCVSAQGAGAATPVLMLGGKVAAAGAYAYLEQGYSGAGGYGLGRSAEGGLSPWAVMWDVASDGSAVELQANVPHVTIGILDGTGVDLSHPALLSVGGEPRVKYYIDASGVFNRASAMYDVQPRIADGHGTTCAAIAFGSVMDGQDARLVSEFHRELRSGVARRAMAVGVDTSGPIGMEEILEAMHDGGELAHALPSGLGVDVLSYSVNENDGPAGVIGNPNGLDDCPTNEQSRGLDATSLAITRAYREENVVVVKSAGNTHGTPPFDAVGNCGGSGGVKREVSAPGAAPAAVSVGATAIFGTKAFPQDTPAGVQQSYDLYTYSARGRTGDGRAYPMLLAQG